MTGWDSGGLTAPTSVVVDDRTAPAASRVSLTLKSDGAYDAPWYVIHGSDAQEILSQLKDPSLQELLTVASAVSTHWAKHQMSSKGLTPVAEPPKAQFATQAPAAAAPADSGPAPQCPHGPREWKDFTSKAGNHVKGWFCTTRNSDCKPLYAK